MRAVLTTSALLFLAACSKQASDLPAYDNDAAPAASDAREARAPGIAVTAAPGVAFNYRYAFRLPNARISAVQEQHAQACEKLGINRCRITGMRYQVRGEHEVAAMLAFKLDPAIARQFGKDAIGAVEKAEGMLVDSEIGGVDAGSAIKRADKAGAQLRDELTRIEDRLRLSGLSSAERVRLEQEASDLRRQIGAVQDERDDQAESLATTPMVFDYGSGSLIPGFDGSSPLRDAAASAVRSFVSMLSFIVLIVGALLPWILLGIALLSFWRSAAGRRVRGWLWPARTEPLAAAAE